MTIFKPPTPTVIASSGGGGSGTSLNTSDASVILNTNPATGASNVVFTTNNSPAMTIDESQNVTIGTTTSNPSDRLVVVAPSSGNAISIIQGVTQAQAQLNISSLGTLAISTSGRIIDLTNNSINIDNNSIIINGSTVTATANQLNYLTATPGSAAPSKALVLNSSSSIIGVNSFSATTLSGTLQTAYQPNINRVGSLAIDSSLSLAGISVLSTATELNYVHVEPGTANASKALVLDSSSNIVGIASLAASQLTGTLLTAAQPNVTSLGTLSALNVSGSLGVGTTSPSTDLELYNISNPSLTLNNGTHISGVSIDTNGNLILNPGNNVLIQANKSIQLNGNAQITGANRISANYLTGVLETADQSNITSVGTLSDLLISGTLGVGTGSPDKKMEILDSGGNCLRLSRTSILYADLLINANGDLELRTTSDIRLSSGTTLRFDSGAITGLDSIIATSLTGTLSTAAQTNITSVGTLGSLAVTNDISAGSLSASTITGTLQTATQTNITSVGTLGALAVTNGISAGSLSASTITGTLQTANQTNITSVGTLGALAVTSGITAGSLSASTITGTIATANQPNITAIGTLTNLTIANTLGVGTINATNINGQILTADQSNITSVGTLFSLDVGGAIAAGSISASTLTGTLSTATQPNITSIGTLGSLAVTNAINAGSLSANTITGTLQTAAQTNITSVGTLNHVYTSGQIGINLTSPSFDIDINSTTGRLLQGSYNDNVVSLTISNTGDCTLYTDHNDLILSNGTGLNFSGGGDISGLSSLSAINLSGTIQTAAQPNITSVGALSTLDVGSILIGSTHTSSFDLSIVTTTGRLFSLSDGTTTITHQILADEYVISSNSGSVVLGTNMNLVVNGGTIIGLSALTSTSLTGTIQTAAQPNITSVGTLTSVVTSGSLTLGSTEITESEISVVNGVTPGTVAAGKALVVDYNKDIASIRNLTADTLTGYIQTAAQPNITSVGALNNLTIGSTNIIEDDISIIAGIIPGNASPSKALVLNSSSQLSGISFLGTTILSLGGVSLGDTEASYLTSITAGTAANSKALVLDGSGNIVGINSISTAALIVNGVDITSNGGGGGSLAYITDITPGSAAASKALVLDSGSSINGINTLKATQMTLGNSSNTTMPLEIGFTSFVMSSAYAYNTNVNSHGTIASGGTTSYNYSIRALGRILCTQSVDVTSDRRLKCNIQNLDDSYCTKFITDTTPVSFNLITGDTQLAYGYLAQDLLRNGFGDLVNLAIDPDMEQEVDPDGLISPQGHKFTISYQHIIPILAKNQKRLMQENKDLSDRVDKLMDLINQLIQQKR
jgi:hypothetical protein